MKATTVIITCLVLSCVSAGHATENIQSPLIHRGSIEVSTVGPAWSAMNVFGATLSIDGEAALWATVAYYPISYVGLEVSPGMFIDGESSFNIITGKLVLTSTRLFPPGVPYVFGGGGFSRCSHAKGYDNTQSVLTFGAGVKIPFPKPLERVATRFEYSYNKIGEKEGGSETFNRVSVGFSVFFR